jgi:hypothetical protein
MLLIVAILLPTALGCALIGASRTWGWWTERRHRRAPAPVPIESLGATLRRLHAQLEALENQPLAPGKGLPVRAAYVDALCTACRRLEIAAPHRPVPRTEIYRVEADLRRNGLDLRRTVPG